VSLILAAFLVLALGLPAGRWLAMTVWNAIHPRPMLPHGELRIAIDPSYPPFAVDLGGELAGFEVELSRAVVTEMGVAYRFVPMGFDGLYDSLRADQADVIFSALHIDAQRMNEVAYAISYFDAGQVLIVPQSAATASMRDLERRNVAVEFGSDGDLEAHRWQRRLHELDIRPYALAAEALDAVRNGEADAALVDSVTARLWLRDHPGQLAQAAQVTHDPYAAAVRIDNPRLLNAINVALEALRNSGEYDEIMRRWF
jgi:polar amino acid transport system substrate-binding protein